MTSDMATVGTVTDRTAKGAGTAAVIMQSPNFFGVIEDMEAATALAHEHGTLSVACVDPISLAVIQPPGEYGADIAAGDGQPSETRSIMAVHTLVFWQQNRTW